MKIINEKGKLFGLINIVDLLVLVFVLLVVGGVSWKIFGNQLQSVAAPTKEITYVVRIRGTFPRYYESLTAQPLPQQIAAGDGLIKDATLVKAESVPYVTQVTTADGRIVDATDSTKIDILCTIEAKINDTDIIKVGTQEVRVGKDHIVKTKYFDMNGNIESITILDAK